MIEFLLIYPILYYDAMNVLTKTISSLLSSACGIIVCNRFADYYGWYFITNKFRYFIDYI